MATTLNSNTAVQEIHRSLASERAGEEDSRTAGPFIRATRRGPLRVLFDRTIATSIHGRTDVRILVVEDDTLLADGIVSVLARVGHGVEHTASGVRADALLQNDAYDLVVLDVGLPDIDGFEVLRRLRARRSPASVIMLTARDGIDDRVRGLDLGADDYLTKPFSVTEFEARVRALLRRVAPPGGRWSIAGLSVDTAARRVKLDGKRVELTPREWELLELFLSRRGRVLGKDEIAEQVFGFDEYLSPNAIEVHVSRLRAKIDPAGLIIRTVRGFGYLWDGDGG